MLHTSPSAVQPRGQRSQLSYTPALPSASQGQAHSPACYVLKPPNTRLSSLQLRWPCLSASGCWAVQSHAAQAAPFA
jgi:hypothetical protein